MNSTRLLLPTTLKVVLTMAKEFGLLAIQYGVGTVTHQQTERLDDTINRAHAKEFDKQVIRTWLASCGYHDQHTPTGQIIRGMLYAAISQSLLTDYREPDARGQRHWQAPHIGFWAGTKSQQLLLAGFEKAEPHERQQFFAAIRQLGEEADISLVGALAVAYTCEALRHTRLVIGMRAGTSYEDLAKATDLVVTSKRGNAGRCILQVKAAGKTTVYLVPDASRPLSFLNLPKPLRNDRGLTLVQNLWEVAYSDRCKYKCPCYGLVVTVNIDHLSLATLFDQSLCDLLRKTLLDTGLFGSDEPPAPLLP